MKLFAPIFILLVAGSSISSSLHTPLAGSAVVDYGVWTDKDHGQFSELVTQTMAFFTHEASPQPDFVVRFASKGPYRVGVPGALGVEVKNKGTKTANSVILYWSSSQESEREVPLGIGSLAPAEKKTGEIDFTPIYNQDMEEGAEKSWNQIKIERIEWREDRQTRTATSDEWSIWVDTFVDKALGDLTGKSVVQLFPSEGVWVGPGETRTIAFRWMIESNAIAFEGMAENVSIRVVLPWFSVMKVTGYANGKFQFSRNIWTGWGGATRIGEMNVGIITLTFHPLFGFGHVYVDPAPSSASSFSESDNLPQRGAMTSSFVALPISKRVFAVKALGN